MITKDSNTSSVQTGLDMKDKIVVIGATIAIVALILILLIWG